MVEATGMNQVLAHAVDEQPDHHDAVRGRGKAISSTPTTLNSSVIGPQAAAAHEPQQRRDEHHQEARQLARKFEERALEAGQGKALVEEVIKCRVEHAGGHAHRQRGDGKQDQLARGSPEARDQVRAGDRCHGKCSGSGKPANRSNK
jgi:hypothetical protein